MLYKKSIRLYKILIFVFATLALLSFTAPVNAGNQANNPVPDCIPVAIQIVTGQGCVPKDGAILAWIKAIILFLSGGVGIAVVGGIVWGGILYTTARDNAAQTQKAVMVITNALIGLLLYIMMFAIINFIIPGGIIS